MMPELRNEALEILGDRNNESQLDDSHCVFVIHEGYEIFTIQKVFDEGAGRYELFRGSDAEEGLVSADCTFEELVIDLAEMAIKYGGR